MTCVFWSLLVAIAGLLVIIEPTICRVCCFRLGLKSCLIGQISPGSFVVPRVPVVNKLCLRPLSDLACAKSGTRSLSCSFCSLRFCRLPSKPLPKTPSPDNGKYKTLACTSLKLFKPVSEAAAFRRTIWWKAPARPTWSRAFVDMANISLTDWIALSILKLSDWSLFKRDPKACCIYETAIIPYLAADWPWKATLSIAFNGWVAKVLFLPQAFTALEPCLLLNIGSNKSSKLGTCKVCKELSCTGKTDLYSSLKADNLSGCSQRHVLDKVSIWAWSRQMPVSLDCFKPASSPNKWARLFWDFSGVSDKYWQNRFAFLASDNESTESVPTLLHDTESSLSESRPRESFSLWAGVKDNVSSGWSCLKVTGWMAKSESISFSSDMRGLRVPIGPASSETGPLTPAGWSSCKTGLWPGASTPVSRWEELGLAKVCTKCKIEPSCSSISFPTGQYESLLKLWI